MTTRAELKRRALDGLGNHYWSAFLVCLIATVLGGAGGKGQKQAEVRKKLQK